MRLVGLAVVLALSLLISPVAAAQQPGKIPKIGVLFLGSATLSEANVTALRDGLRQLGYIEGQRIAIDYRFADGNLDRLPALADEFIRTGAQIIVVSGTTPALVVKKRTSVIPIVFAGVSDPIEAGLAASFAHPGSNATGLSTAHEDGFAGKWVELLREVIPAGVRVIVIHNPSNPSNIRYWREMQAASRPLRITLHSLEATSPETLDRALLAITREYTDGLIVATDPFLFAQRTRIVDAANHQRVPTVFGFKDFVVKGGLMSYGANVPDMFRRAATYIDKILKGAKPADLPIEQPTKFELVINLKTAKALGLTIPQSILVRADEIIQ